MGNLEYARQELESARNLGSAGSGSRNPGSIGSGGGDYGSNASVSEASSSGGGSSYGRGYGSNASIPEHHDRNGNYSSNDDATFASKSPPSPGFAPKPPPSPEFASKPPPSPGFALKPPPSPGAGGGGGGNKSLGMSREELDRLTKQRLKEERRKQYDFTRSANDHSRKPSVEDERKQYAASTIDQGRHREAESYGARGGGRGSGGSVGSSKMSQEDTDRLTKQRLKEERKKQYDFARSANDHSRKPSFEDERGQYAASAKDQGRHYKSSSYEEDDDDAAQDEMKQPAVVDEYEQRRRRQVEADRRIKERVRQQMGGVRSRGSNNSSSSNSDEGVKKSEAVARASGNQASRKNSDVNEDDNHGAESEAGQPRWKQSMQRDNVDDVEERRRRRLERAGQRGRRETKRIPSIFEEDSFEAGLSSLPTTDFSRPNKDKGGTEDDQNDPEDLSQNVINMHIAQLRATSKIAADAGEDYDCFEVDPNAPLDEYCSLEESRNRDRRMSRRVSANTMRIDALLKKYTLKKAVELAERSPEEEWLSSFYRCDPRWQIMKFFDEVAREGGKATMDENVGLNMIASLFNKASVFTVWRPTSDEAIKNMMLGIATGKGLDIKGKSAKRGNISSYVPFIQIFEDAHKESVRAFLHDGKIVRVFYRSEEARTMAKMILEDMKSYMLFTAQDAMRVLSDEYADPEEHDLAMKHLQYDDVKHEATPVDDYIDSDTPVYGLDITERLFWESYIMMNYCDRPEGTEWDIGRKSEPAFMDMNLKSIRHDPEPGSPRAVVYQMSTESPMDPRTLLMAYEEYGKVKPVVSDFDCFLLGSRGVKYENPIPKDQVELVKWSVKNISEVLEERAANPENQAGWMDSWFKVLKKAALKGFYPKTPKYGNGDPKSYEIVSVAVSRLNATGCVRHGAECFNWFFPQEIDETFLVISDTLPGNLKWKKVKVPELQDILLQKINEGFTFPINPKWVLCDPGWRRVYDKLLTSKKPNVQDSINCWLPPGSGLREEIDRISAKYPLGFEGGTPSRLGATTEGTEVRDMMEEDLERYFKMQRAWRKLRLVLYWIRFVREKRREKEERESLLMMKVSH